MTHNQRLEWTEPYFVMAAVALCNPKNNVVSPLSRDVIPKNDEVVYEAQLD
jgi:hypothetical protein